MLLEYYDCTSGSLDNIDKIKNTFLTAAEAGNATIVSDSFHQFNPHGVSGVIIISESHITVHTWPEHNFAAVDIFSCSIKLDMECIHSKLLTTLLPGRTSKKLYKRGLLSP